VVAYCTHPVLSGRCGGAHRRVGIDELVVTDSIPLSKAAQACKRSACCRSRGCSRKRFANPAMRIR